MRQTSGIPRSRNRPSGSKESWKNEHRRPAGIDSSRAFAHDAVQPSAPEEAHQRRPFHGAGKPPRRQKTEQPRRPAKNPSQGIGKKAPAHPAGTPTGAPAILSDSAHRSIRHGDILPPTACENNEIERPEPPAFPCAAGGQAVLPLRHANSCMLPELFRGHFLRLRHAASCSSHANASNSACKATVLRPRCHATTMFHVGSRSATGRMVTPRRARCRTNWGNHLCALSRQSRRT